MKMTWQAKLKCENAAMTEVIRQLTDEELVRVSARLREDETVHLKEEALEIIKRHQQARLVTKQLVDS